MYDFRRLFLENQVSSFAAMKQSNAAFDDVFANEAGDLAASYVGLSLRYWQSQLDRHLADVHRRQADYRAAVIEHLAGT